MGVIIKVDKFSLVYEFNKDSPLITYQASKEIHAGNYTKALDLLVLAIEKYPEHLTAHLLKSIALAHNGKYEEAKNLLKDLKYPILTSDTVNFYVNEIDRIKRSADGISVSFDETVNEVLNDSFLEEEQLETRKDFELLDDNFDFNDTEKDAEIEPSSIVTETLAEIYASQQNYDEALEIYEKLKELKPEMKEKFDKRISELTSAIENKKSKKFGN